MSRKKRRKDEEHTDWDGILTCGFWLIIFAILAHFAIKGHLFREQVSAMVSLLGAG